MEKSIFSPGHKVLLDLLRRTREEAGLTQVQFAAALGTTQSAVSKCERGERRLDVLEVRTWCRGAGKPFVDFARELDQALGETRGRPAKKGKRMDG